MSFIKSGLKINGEVYKPKISVPTLKDLLTLSQQELQEILDMKVSKGPIIKQNGNSFQAFSICTQSYDHIRKAYMHLKLYYPEAQHIICAYNIPGLQTHYTHGSCDDGEHYTGEKILKSMELNSITSRALFITRYTDGTKLRPKRFELIINAAQKVVEAHPFNSFVNKDQQMTTKNFTQTKQNEAQNKNITTTPNASSLIRSKEKDTSHVSPVTKDLLCQETEWPMSDPPIESRTSVQTTMEQ